MILVAALLAVNAVLHGVVVRRFGRRGNLPFLAFAAIYGALAVAVALSLPYALWAALILSAIGLTGLTLTFGRVNRDRTLDRIIWVLDAATIALLVFVLAG